MMGKALLNAVGLWARILGPAVMIVCGVAIFRAAMRNDDDGGISEAGAFALPVSLCLDNVIAGVGISPLAGHALDSALCIGLISALMSLTGAYGAQWLRGILSRLAIPRLEMLGAAYLVVLALRSLAQTAT
jgi:putative Mn2+ efflux pump MntP